MPPTLTKCDSVVMSRTNRPISIAAMVKPARGTAKCSRKTSFNFLCLSGSIPPTFTHVRHKGQAFYEGRRLAWIAPKSSKISSKPDRGAFPMRPFLAGLVNSGVFGRFGETTLPDFRPKPGRGVVDSPSAIFAGYPAATTFLLTIAQPSPSFAEISIKSGGGTGPTMPRQPVPRKRDGQVPIPGPS
jgi:hypothetical protein